MLLLFFHSTGEPQQSRQYSGPGNWGFGQDREVVQDFPQEEGDVVNFHVGHGVSRDYLVAAKDASCVLLQRT